MRGRVSLPFSMSVPRDLPTVFWLPQMSRMSSTIWKASADLPAVESQASIQSGRFGGEHGAEAAAGFGEGGGFAVDDEVVGFFVERPVAPVVVLGQFAFADDVGGVGDEAAGGLRRSRRGESRLLQRW